MNDLDFLKMLYGFMVNYPGSDGDLVKDIRAMIATRIDEKTAAKTLGASGQRKMRETLGPKKYSEAKRKAAKRRWGK